MVDHVNKINQNIYRVKETSDATDEEKNQAQDGDEDAQGDEFDQKNANSLTARSAGNLMSEQIEVKVEDIDRVKLLNLNLNADPSVLKVRIFMYDGEVIDTALLSVARAKALKIKATQKSAFVDVNLITDDPVIRVSVPGPGAHGDDDITRITVANRFKDITLSQTFKFLRKQKDFLERLGLRDPNSKDVNTEYVWIYVTVLLVAAALTFSALYLAF